MAQKITHYLLITLILALGYGQLLRFEFFGVPLYLHDILVLLLVFQTRSYFTRTVLVKYRGLWILCLGMALGWVYAVLHYPTSTLLVPLLYSLRLIAYLTLYLTLKHSKTLISSSYFLISGNITLLIGYLQYFLLPDMRVFQYLGWDDHLNRLIMPHFDPTFTAIMLGLVFYSHPNTTLTFAILPALLLTYSRSVWLSLIFTFLLMAKNKALVLIASFCLLITIFVALPKKFGEGNNLLRTYSITSRIATDVEYVKQVGTDLIWGRGLNTLILELPANFAPNHATGPNNSYLYLLATTGVLGLAGFLDFLHKLYLTSPYRQLLIFFLIASLFNNILSYSFTLLWVLLLHSTVPNAT